jgi:hypothetical protein
MPNAVKTFLWFIGVAVGVYTAIDAFRGYWRMYRQYGPSVHAAAYHWWTAGPVRATLSVAIVGAAVVAGVFLVWVRRLPATSPSGTQSPPASEQLADFGKRLDKLTEALMQNPSVDDKAKLPVLREDYDRMSKQKEELTTQQQEVLREQGLTLKSLEQGKQNRLAAKELERLQSESLAKQQKIEQQQKEKERLAALEVTEIEFAKRYAPIVDYTANKLYELLGPISKEAGETISTDFPNGSPSINGSNMLKDGKIVSGQHVIRVGNNPDWEFRFRIQGLDTAPAGTWRGDPHRFYFMITAGTVYVSMVAVPSPNDVTPISFSLVFSESDKNGPAQPQTCSLTDFRAPIDRALTDLIQNRYNTAPLKAKP